MRAPRDRTHRAMKRQQGPARVMIAAIVVVLLGWGWPATTAWSATDMTDADISNAVRDALIEDPGVNATQIDVETQNGVVTLSGTVSNVLAKDRATRVAETVRGVVTAVNTIDVLAPLHYDLEIQQDIEDAWLRDPATESYDVAASVEDGIATLTGTVDSWQEKQLAATVAKGVRGVKGIRNQIDVEYPVDRSDYEIETEVEGALKWDVRVDHALINVAVEDDRVILSGTVGSSAEKRRAIADAWVAGVDSVNADDLEVASWAREERFRKGKYVEKTDAEIAQAVEDALLYDPRVLSFNVDVSVDDGVATLSGKVNNLKAKRAAARCARDVVGVWRVKNNIQVRPDAIADAVIESEVEQALLTDPYVERYDVTVTVTDNEVYLYGDVDSSFEKAQAEDAASAVEGVVAVHNRLDVEEEYEPYTYDPYIDTWDPYTYEWNGYTDDYATTKSDWEIEADIEDELFWSPFVDSDEVTVSVEDGVATLTGTVDTLSERSAAEKNAYDGGAVSVDNDLAVLHGPDYYEP